MGFFDKIKDVADTVVDSVEKGAKNVSETSKKTADKMRIKKEINKFNSDINKAYASIGQKYFELNADAPAEEYVDAVNSIIDAKIKLDELNAELLALENKHICSNCGKTIKESHKFCPSCGTQNESFVEEATEEKTDDIVEAEVVDSDSEENE